MPQLPDVLCTRNDHSYATQKYNKLQNRRIPSFFSLDMVWLQEGLQLDIPGRCPRWVSPSRLGPLYSRCALSTCPFQMVRIWEDSINALLSPSGNRVAAAVSTPIILQIGCPALVGLDYPCESVPCVRVLSALAGAAENTFHQAPSPLDPCVRCLSALDGATANSFHQALSPLGCCRISCYDCREGDDLNRNRLSAWNPCAGWPQLGI